MVSSVVNNADQRLVYIGQRGRTIQHRINEHSRHIRLDQPDKSAVAEHSITQDHTINLQDTKLLSVKSGYMDRLVREAIEIQLHPHNINRGDGLYLTNTWKPLIRIIYDGRHHSQPQRHKRAVSSN